MWSSTRGSLVALTASILVQPIAASIIPDFLQSLDILQNVEKRCDNACGYYGQLCCASNEYCYTDANGQAQCGANSNVQTQNGQWQYYTTTYVQTDLQTVTATFSSYIGATTVAPTTLSCSYSQGETPCGNVCCISGQYCQKSGSCVAVPGGSSGYYSSLFTVTTIITNTASAPIRPTTQTVRTITSTGSISGTTAFQTPVGSGGAVLSGSTSESSGGLSGGAIAGIVIGVIAGILILLLICLCCCFKGLLDGVLALFGLGGRRRRTEETIIEERHSRHGGANRRWFGAPGRTEVVEEKRKTSSGFGLATGVAAALGGLAIALGLKRRRDRRDEGSESSYIGSSYYDGTSASSPSSVTRTRSRSRSRVSRR